MVDGTEPFLIVDCHMDPDTQYFYPAFPSLETCSVSENCPQAHNILIHDLNNKKAFVKQSTLHDMLLNNFVQVRHNVNTHMVFMHKHPFLNTFSLVIFTYPLV